MLRSDASPQPRWGLVMLTKACFLTASGPTTTVPTNQSSLAEASASVSCANGEGRLLKGCAPVGGLGVDAPQPINRRLRSRAEARDDEGGC